LCRHHHGITWDEFQTLTLANIEALEYRRKVTSNYDRYNAGLVASAVINVNLMPDAKRVDPFDFIPDIEEDEEDEQRDAVKHGIVVAFSRLPNDVTPDAVQELKHKIIQRLMDQGYDDADAIFAEVFPDIA
jgi:hypothetical protein